MKDYDKELRQLGPGKIVRMDVLQEADHVKFVTTEVLEELHGKARFDKELCQHVEPGPYAKEGNWDDLRDRLFTAEEVSEAQSAAAKRSLELDLKAADKPKERKEDKPDLSYLEWSFLLEMAKAMRQGATKPGRHKGGWKNQEGTDSTRAACARHLASIMQGLEADEEGVDNDVRIACNAMMRWFFKHGA